MKSFTIEKVCTVYCRIEVQALTAEAAINIADGSDLNDYETVNESMEPEGPNKVVFVDGELAA